MINLLLCAPFNGLGENKTIVAAETAFKIMNWKRLAFSAFYGESSCEENM